MEVSPWFGVVGPAKVPQPVIVRISDALAKSLKDPSVRERLATIGAVPIEGSTPESFLADIRAEVAFWKKFVADTNFPLMD